MSKYDKLAIMESERILKALAKGRRLAILRLLSLRKELPVQDVASRLKLSLHATSKHLLMMERAGILNRRQDSRYVIYAVVRPLHPIVNCVAKLAHSH